MGWTHYWEREPEFPTEAFARAAADCRTAVLALGVPLGNELGENAPVWTAEEIVFNGTRGAGCEPFVVRRHEMPRRGRPRVFSYCKTEQLPYDLCVRVALIVLKHCLGTAITVTSDGGDAEWQQARDACQEHLGYGQDFRLDKP